MPSLRVAVNEPKVLIGLGLSSAGSGTLGSSNGASCCIWPIPLTGESPGEIVVRQVLIFQQFQMKQLETIS